MGRPRQDSGDRAEWINRTCYPGEDFGIERTLYEISHPSMLTHKQRQLDVLRSAVRTFKNGAERCVREGKPAWAFKYLARAKELQDLQDRRYPPSPTGAKDNG